MITELQYRRKVRAQSLTEIKQSIRKYTQMALHWENLAERSNLDAHWERARHYASVVKLAHSEIAIRSLGGSKMTNHETKIREQMALADKWWKRLEDLEIKLSELN